MTSSTTSASLQAQVPKVTIEYCTQCKWLLRAAYYAQELLSTFGTSLGEVSLRPKTGGTFVVIVEHAAPEQANPATTSTVIWDRKRDQGFPETKELKRRLRDIVEPGRDLGHVDRHSTNVKHTENAVSVSEASRGADPNTGPIPTSSSADGSISREPAPCEDCQ